jgi:hypothetical protein
VEVLELIILVVAVVEVAFKILDNPTAALVDLV